MVPSPRAGLTASIYLLTLLALAPPPATAQIANEDVIDFKTNAAWNDIRTCAQTCLVYYNGLGCKTNKCLCQPTDFILAAKTVGDCAQRDCNTIEAGTGIQKFYKDYCDSKGYPVSVGTPTTSTAGGSGKATVTVTQLVGTVTVTVSPANPAAGPGSAGVGMMGMAAMAMVVTVMSMLSQTTAKASSSSSTAAAKTTSAATKTSSTTQTTSTSGGDSGGLGTNTDPTDPASKTNNTPTNVTTPGAANNGGGSSKSEFGKSEIIGTVVGILALFVAILTLWVNWKKKRSKDLIARSVSGAARPSRADRKGAFPLSSVSPAVTPPPQALAPHSPHPPPHPPHHGPVVHELYGQGGQKAPVHELYDTGKTDSHHVTYSDHAAAKDTYGQGGYGYNDYGQPNVYLLLNVVRRESSWRERLRLRLTRLPPLGKAQYLVPYISPNQMEKVSSLVRAGATSLVPTQGHEVVVVVVLPCYLGHTCDRLRTIPNRVSYPDLCRGPGFCGKYWCLRIPCTVYSADPEFTDGVQVFIWRVGFALGISTFSLRTDPEGGLRYYLFRNRKSFTTVGDGGGVLAIMGLYLSRTQTLEEDWGAAAPGRHLLPGPSRLYPHTIYIFANLRCKVTMRSLNAPQLFDVIDLSKALPWLTFLGWSIAKACRVNLLL
ncbi:hypothetical protein DFH27DRAFT_525350 [Peziza echinospora]|nr:hypothetical protein DFH27DRAFT_525350 [Peziza echinospora]